MSETNLNTPAWLDGPLGRTLAACETPVVEQALSQAFGLQMLQIGAWGEPGRFIAAARTLRAAVVSAEPGPGVSMVCRPARLGVASASVDTVLLPHTLERDPEPHNVLREVERVLVGEGHLIVLGFNPYGLWGLRRALSRRRFPAGIDRLVPEGRLRDWLALLGLEVVDARRYLFPLPLNRESVQRRCAGLEQVGVRFWPGLSGAYMLVAQKRVYSVTPLRPSRQRRLRVVGGGLAEPTTRSAA